MNFGFKKNRDVKVALLRLHKTGSTSIHEALSRKFRKRDVSDYAFAWQYYGNNSEEHLSRRYVWPHMTLPQFKATFGKHADSYSVVIPVRDPVERLVSVFNYFKGQSTKETAVSTHNVANELKDMNFEDFLGSNSAVIQRARDNILTKFLSYGYYGRTPDSRAEIFLEDSRAMDQCYSEAKRAVMCGAVTFVDCKNIEASRSRLAKIFHEQPEGITIPHVNKTPKIFSEINDKQVEKIKVILKRDIDIYNLIVDQISSN
jgi:hypothetical protein